MPTDSHQVAVIGVILMLTIAIDSRPTPAATATGSHGMIATVQPLATKAGLAAFAKGGNAVDAAVAAALTLGVVDGHNSGLGGGCFVLIRLADGRVVALDGREMAPQAATRDMYLRNGQPNPSLSLHGPLAIGVPGALAAYDRVIQQYGKLDLSTPLRYAARIADQGFEIDRVYAGNLHRTAPWLARFPATRDLLLKSDGTPYLVGQTLRLPDLAATYRELAEHGTDWFYRGEFATRVAGWMQENGGIITAEDFANYVAKARSPIRTSYRGFEIIGFPPPSSGGIHVAQILNILETFDLTQWLEDDPGLAYHVIAEAMKLAFADRAHWLGDADYTSVPRGLISKTYARQLAAQIDLNHARDVARHGMPPAWDSDLFGKHTTHIAAADAEGNWVAITATVNTSFGSKVVVPGTGLVLNNEMDDFSAQPGAPNAFGLVGAEANAIAPGKRPLSSMSPTIVLRDGRPVMTLGAAGGPKIITQVVLGIIHHLDADRSIAESVQRARIHHQWRPGQLFVESTLDDALVRQLQERGHETQTLSSSGVMQAIGLAADGTFIGTSDPRVPGSAVGADSK